jgi:hypothetical protein
VLLGVLHVQNARKIVLRNATGVGLTEDDVTRRLGAPNAVITTPSEFAEPLFSAYSHSQRPMTTRALVYFRFGEMIVVYLDHRGHVAATYWGEHHPS